ncbi:hypothetical protein GCM10025876_07870 [Demequina litorisediminis]|uniref:Aldehyde oxidase/xanthine dehydrogenase second molybdopterin binding domain-containing protein n=2 Tax=Demequina litorisediminis TaxID=1849022 RepID=A0ABQ6I9P7_9MICO|nr:hypothetical protein GCM10025876_07870 [Demequina litorisediminis]
MTSLSSLNLDPFEMRRLNAVRPGDDFIVAGAPEEDLKFGSYGLDECLDLARETLAGPDDVAPPAGWDIGEGMAASMIATLPPRGHRSVAAVGLGPDGVFQVRSGTAEFGNGTTTVHRQVVSEVFGVPWSRIALVHADTDAVRHDTGAFGSTGIVVASKALHASCVALQDVLVTAGASVLGIAPEACSWTPDGVTGGGRTATVAEVLAAADPSVMRGDSAWCETELDQRERSVAFNVQAFRVAVRRATGEVRILKSVQTADAGVVINPEQCRGQIEGGVAQGIGSALYEEVLIAPDGSVSNPAFRQYRIPQMADVPRTHVLFATTSDALGPYGAKSMSESPYNPVAPALANAIRRAVGVRPFTLPMTRDRVWRMLQRRRGVASRERGWSRRCAR